MRTIHRPFTDGSISGEFPASLASFGALRGVSHFIVLDETVNRDFHEELASTLSLSRTTTPTPSPTRPDFGRFPCHSIDGPLDLGASGLAMCIDKAWGVAWPPRAPRAVVLHALIFPKEDMSLAAFESCFPVTGGGSAPSLPYKPCVVLPKVLNAQLSPRPWAHVSQPGLMHAVSDDGVPLQSSESNGQVVWVLADALRRGVAAQDLLSPTDAALALFMRHHFCVDLEGFSPRPLLDEDTVARSDKLALIAHKCLQAMPPDSYSDHFGFWAALKSLRAEMAAVVQNRGLL
jgi:hypothetical protein